MANNSKKNSTGKENYGEPKTNLCKQAFLEGQGTCGGEDLLTECKEWRNKLNILFVTKGVPNTYKKKII